MKWLWWLFGAKPSPAPGHADEAAPWYGTRGLERLDAAFGEALQLGASFHRVAPEFTRRVREASTADWLSLQGGRTAVTEEHLKLLIAAPVELRPELLALASLSRNGFVRQASVLELAKLDDPRALRYLAPRLGDWVAQVRAAAAQACTRLVSRAATAELLRFGDEFDVWLSVRWRAEAVTLRALLEHELLGARWTEVRTVLITPGARHRVFVRRLCLRADRFDAASLRELVRDPDPAMRQAVAAPLALRALDLDAATIDAVLHDATPRVVARFVAALPQQAVSAFAARLQPLCFARRPLVRGVVRGRLESIGWYAAPECRRRLAGAPRDVEEPVIACLGESGTREDQALLAPYVEHASPSVRAAALRALGQVDGDGWWPTAVERLASAHAIERRAAADVLRRVPRFRWLDDVRSVAANGCNDAQAAATRMLLHDATRGGWSVMPDVLSAILTGRSATQAWGRMRGWCARNLTRGWLQPDDTTRSALRGVWARWKNAPPEIPEDLRAVVADLSRWIERELA